MREHEAALYYDLAVIKDVYKLTLGQDMKRDRSPSGLEY